MKKVLYSVLNWGLGHASRSTPIIEYLIQCKYEVHIASDGIALDFLKQRFPSCKFKELPSYDIKYAKNKNLSWKLLLQLPHIASTIKKEQNVIEILHKEENFDLVISDNRKRIKKNKVPKFFKNEYSKKIIKNLPFDLTKSQIDVFNEINYDLLSNNRMFRIIQGDVGSGKTIVSMLSIINIVKSGYQCALMSPTAILSKQHYELSKKIFKNTIKIEFLTGKTENKIRAKSS